MNRLHCKYFEGEGDKQPTIWIFRFKPLGQLPYPSEGASMIALTMTQAIELRQELDKAIKEAIKARES